MQHGVIEDYTICLRGNGADIHDLHARAVEADGYIAVTTAWIPTPAEVLRIIAGEPVYVTLLLSGAGFPPMRVEVKQ